MLSVKRLLGGEEAGRSAHGQYYVSPRARPGVQRRHETLMATVVVTFKRALLDSDWIPAQGRDDVQSAGQTVRGNKPQPRCMSRIICTIAEKSTSPSRSSQNAS